MNRNKPINICQLYIKHFSLIIFKCTNPEKNKVRNTAKTTLGTTNSRFFHTALICHGVWKNTICVLKWLGVEMFRTFHPLLCCLFRNNVFPLKIHQFIAFVDIIHTFLPIQGIVQYNTYNWHFETSPTGVKNPLFTR